MTVQPPTKREPTKSESGRERELQDRLRAAEARLVQTAVKLLKHAKREDVVRQVVLEAAGEVSPMNGNSPVHDIVPFWADLSDTQKHKVGGILRDV